MAASHRTIHRLLSKWKPRSPSHYQQLMLLNNTDHSGLACLAISSKKCKRRVPVLAGNERKIFWLERHILEHWLFQDLLQSSCCDYSELELLQDDETDFWCGRPKGRKTHSVQPICFQCDSLLFEFFLWLVENDDPSLRDLNLNDLMEFYDAES